ncbi:MAG TPA: Gfo/Idh/MocA family oxidoreductase [Candidatus Latescibacteria bacterium]|nr:Gfo/Idh/MocA family oxidoreductase [Candidatus Latescibacterota bacterium]
MPAIFVRAPGGRYIHGIGLFSVLTGFFQEAFMAARYRVAIVGCGGIAHTHADSCRKMPEVDIVGLADVRPEALAEFGKTFEVPAERHFTDYVTMFDAVKPDIVCVCTRPAQHCAPTVAALQRGIHVLCEKPMALDLEEADAMVAASEQSGAKLAINTQRHTDPVYLYAVKLVKEGRIGELRTLRSECKTYEAGYGMMNIGAHYLDAMRLFGSDAAWVFAHLTNAAGNDITPADIEPGERDTGLTAGKACTMQIGYASGVMGVSEYWVGTATFGFEIVGTKGALAIRGRDASIFVTNGGGGKANDEILWETIPVPLADEEKEVVAERRWSTIFMMRALIKGIEENAVPACSGYDGRAVLEQIMATYVSQISGSRAKLPLADRRHPLKHWQ